MDYYIVSQGKTTIPSVDDGEEFTLTDVRIYLETNKNDLILNFCTKKKI